MTVARWFSRCLMAWLVWAAGAASPALSSDVLSHADDSLVLGIFAYRDAAVIQARYQPLADYLDAQLPGTRVTLQALTLTGIETAISHRQIDLLMTNPSHFLQVRSRNSLTGALATQVRFERGEEVSSLGGVVVTLADRRGLDTLGDLKGLRVGIPGKAFLGGYQTQAYELSQMGLSPARELRLPPFDQAQRVSWGDIWNQHRPFLVALVGSLLLVMLLLVLLSRRNRKLKQQRSQMRLAASVFNHTQESIMIISPKGLIIEVNPTFTLMTGYEREEVIGQPATLLGSGHLGDTSLVTLRDALRDTGEWRGEIDNRHKSGRVFPVRLTISPVYDDHGRLQRFVCLMTDITELKSHQRELEYIAFYDSLTGLPSRTLLADRIRNAMTLSKRHQHPMALAFIDLDGFKAVNDTHGHDMGDRLLIKLAERMSGSLRESDTLARLGGDEFVAVLVELTSEEACLPVLDRLLDVISRPVLIDDVQLKVSASLGVAFYPAGEELDADQLLRHADQAMYRAKHQGKNRYACFKPNAVVDSESANHSLFGGHSPSA